jgi:hypothetical protein
MFRLGRRRIWRNTRSASTYGFLHGAPLPVECLRQPVFSSHYGPVAEKCKTSHAMKARSIGFDKGSKVFLESLIFRLVP